MPRKAPSKPAKKTKSRVNEAGNYTKPEMRKRLFNKINKQNSDDKVLQGSYPVILFYTRKLYVFKCMISLNLTYKLNENFISL